MLQALLDSEKEIYLAQAAESGKDAASWKKWCKVVKQIRWGKLLNGSAIC